MNRRSTFAAIGGYQPFLFCIGMYFVALFFSIFICSSIFYAINSGSPVASSKKNDIKKTAMAKSAKPVLLTVSK